MKDVNCGMITRYYMIVLLVLSTMVSYGQNKTVINIGEGSGSGSVAGQDSIKVAILSDTSTAAGDGLAQLAEIEDWYARRYNRIEFDQIGITTDGDTTFAVPEGKYLIQFNSSFGTSVDVAEPFFLRLYNVTDDEVVIYGLQSNFFSTGSAYVDGSKTYSVQYYTGYQKYFIAGGNEVIFPSINGQITIIKLQ
jgi:hypothetical protein